MSHSQQVQLMLQLHSMAMSAHVSSQGKLVPMPINASIASDHMLTVRLEVSLVSKKDVHQHALRVKAGLASLKVDLHRLQIQEP